MSVRDRMSVARFVVAIAALPMCLIAQGTPEAKLKEMHAQQETLAKTVAGSKLVVDLAKLARRSEALKALSTVLGKIADGAGAADRLFRALELEKDGEKRTQLVAKSKLPNWMQAVLDPMQSLVKIERQIDALEVPMFDCADAHVCVAPVDLVGDREALAKKARFQYAAHKKIVDSLAELDSFCAETGERADAASKSLSAMAKGWERAMELGCGVLGNYCGLNWLKATELSIQCNAIRSSAVSKRKDVAAALKIERQRLASWGSWVRLVGVDPTK